jgi:DNA polymerase
MRCGLHNPDAPNLRQWDSEHVGGWSQWLGDLNAEVVVIGQDWGDVAGFKKDKGRDTPRNPTNKRVRDLLQSVGFTVPPAPEVSTNGGVFLTNAVLCLKEGGLQGKVESVWFDNCGPKFLRPLLELIRPNVAVTLGERAYRAVARVFDLKDRNKNFLSVVQTPAVPLFAGCSLVPVYHCGNRVWNGRRREAEQISDWQRVRSALGRP